MDFNFNRWFWIPVIFVVTLTIGAVAAGTQLGTIANYNTTHYTQAGTSCTMATTGAGCSGSGTGDCGTIIDFTNSAGATVTLPNNLTALGCSMTVEQDAAGNVTFSPASGAALISPHTFSKTFAQGSIAGVRLFANSGGTSAQYAMFGDGQ